MPCTVLILEDSPTLLAIFQAALRGITPGAVLLTARYVSEAQKLAAEHNIDLFLLDIHLPDGTGLDFLSDMRMVYPSAQAIIITATPLPEYREYATRAGAVRFIAKPIDAKVLRATVLECLSNSGQAGYEGTLRNLSIVDVIQIKCLGGTTSALEFRSPTGVSGQVFFEDGQIRHAEVGDVTGFDAVVELVGWSGGSIQEIPYTEHGRTVDGYWQIMLMEAVRATDERKKREGA